MPDKIALVLFDIVFVAIADPKDLMKEMQEMPEQTLKITCKTSNLAQHHFFILSRILGRIRIDSKNGAAGLIFRTSKGK